MTSSPSVPPPNYTASTSSNTATLLTTPLDNHFDIVPQADATSFQVGYLGLEGFQAWIKGDVLIKLDERASQQRHLYQHCSITLTANEADQEQSISFFSSTQTLWQNPHTATSSSASSSTSALTAGHIPSTLSFSFQLTDDLPHCIHLPSSSLEYRLQATLHSSDEKLLPSSTRETIVHLTRYSRPNPLDEAEMAPHTWNIETPTPMTVRLQRSIFRRAEPISVYLNIPPPDKKLLSLGLRSVEANLFRTIRDKDGREKHNLLLAHSGKLCRFHSTRAIILHLTLHPPFDSSNMPYPHPDHDAALSGPIYGRGGGGGCESVTQETLLHQVSFHVKILIGIRGDGGERGDVVLQREIKILPGAAGGLDLADNNAGSSMTTSKKAEAEQAAAGEAGPSNWAAAPPLTEEEEEEYDGYEDVGRPLSDDDDEEEIEQIRIRSTSLDVNSGPPPTLLESRNDLQVDVDTETNDPVDLSESPPELESGYTWRREDASIHDDVDLPPPPTPPVEDQSRSFIIDQQSSSGPHRPPPYVAAGSTTTRTPRTTVRQREDAHPPAYPHPVTLPSFVIAPHPPSYEA
jgi:hypothetical protein